jgi:hypothetical protein
MRFSNAEVLLEDMLSYGVKVKLKWQGGKYERLYKKIFNSMACAGIH